MESTLIDEGFQLGAGHVRVVLIGMTGALTLASLAAYLRDWLTHMATPPAALATSGGTVVDLKQGGRTEDRSG